MKKYDVIIVGSGPAGMMAAYELAKNGNMNVAIFEKGEDREKECDEVICGWGGAGSFSDGKIHCNTNVGGQLHNKIDRDVLQQYINRVDDIFVEHGAPTNRYFEDQSYDEDLTRRILSSGLHLIPTHVHHIGTDNAYDVVNHIKNYLLSLGVDIFCNAPIDTFLQYNGEFMVKSCGEEYCCKYLIIAVGRGGTNWLSQLLDPLNIEYKPGSCDVGVRFECDNVIYEHLTNVMYEPKMKYYSKNYDDVVRNFCVNPQGVVVREKYAQANISTVNGHSFADDTRKTNNINFAILVTKAFTEPFTESLRYIEHICELSNMLAGGGILVQRIEDLLKNRRSTEERMLRGPTIPSFKSAVPGDLSLAIPYRIMSGIIEFIDALEMIAPGTKTGLLYGVEAKFYSIQVALNEHMQSSIDDLYICGDCSGHTRSISQAAVSGILAAEDILTKGK